MTTRKRQKKKTKKKIGARQHVAREKPLGTKAVLSGALEAYRFEHRTPGNMRRYMALFEEGAEDVAAITNRTKHTVYKWLRDEIPIGEREIEAMAEHWGTDPASLRYGAANLDFGALKQVVAAVRAFQDEQPKQATLKELIAAVDAFRGGRTKQATLAQIKTLVEAVDAFRDEHPKPLSVDQFASLVTVQYEAAMTGGHLEPDQLRRFLRRAG